MEEPLLFYCLSLLLLICMPQPICTAFAPDLICAVLVINTDLQEHQKNRPLATNASCIIDGPDCNIL